MFKPWGRGPGPWTLLDVGSLWLSAPRLFSVSAHTCSRAPRLPSHNQLCPPPPARSHLADDCAVSPSCSAVQRWRSCLQGPASTALSPVAAQSLAEDTEEEGAKDRTQSPQHMLLAGERAGREGVGVGCQGGGGGLPALAVQPEDLSLIPGTHTHGGRRAPTPTGCPQTPHSRVP